MTTPFTGDRIILKDLGFYGYHGLFSEEAKLGQRFFVDLECGVDLGAPGETDAIGHTVSYADIYDVVKATFEGKRTKLIEALAQNIVTALFAAFADIDWIVIRVRKPEAPIAMVRGEAAIELHRARTH
ncbi:dihydroneopterin aldolase [Devosia sp. 63-57]|uniref:dihydroneopterin aldolase n=1 Tax=Devosia sp. 63-57 TaxID=1895751 RepID=UPI00086B5AD1|nr:dihydroneopterin aldolase [Devosia sp. 63-57]ODT50319.1 MAG: dihydroneopterin aldolase [Pelagibacterium sp. SCN 63-126]ODU86483.1 MAG: dihydroneopterin aldolase [Pelagibacterium sp. SCN 63-17]OJX45063.1 MAG: dihydroneopterin aldolase [Devosia sp. 63-57]